MKECSHCKKTEEETRIIFWRGKMFLCNKHRIQLERYGQFIEHTKYDGGNPIKVIGDYVEVSMFSVHREFAGITIIDLEDLEKIKNKRIFIYGYGYAAFQAPGKKMLVHRYLMGDKKGFFIDHIDGNRLNNRKKNLRWVTIQQNNFNSKKPYGKNKRRGVSFCKQTNSYMVTIEKDGKRYWLGRHKDFNKAVEVRTAAEKEFYGIFAPK